jgi:exopolyphosphatase/guanosine-5'-triphosphate,3'-diphosphate pyrophosphatase
MSTDPRPAAVPAPPAEERPPKVVAVVDIGATAIRMAIAEIREAGPIRMLDEVTQGVSLGKDTFTRGSIESATIEDCVRVLKTYRQLLDEYGIVRPDQIHVVATSAVREAFNRLAFLERIYVATGFRVEPFDEAAVSRATYFGVQPLLASQPALCAARALIIEVGGGSTAALLFQGGDVAFAHTYRLGSLRLRKTLEAYHAPTGKVRRIMESQIQRTVDHLRQKVRGEPQPVLIALGGDMRFAARELIEDWDGQDERLAQIALDPLRSLMEEILGQSVEEVVQRYHLAFPDAESVGPALLTYVKLAEALGLKQVLVSSVNLRDGLIKEMALGQAWTEDLVDQIIRSAVDFGRRFGFDEAHGRHVAELARTLFRALEPEHRLGSRYEVILYIAALLHDLGYAVNAHSHHKHSMYLITHGDLFGLSHRDVLLAAMTARYHRRSGPKPTHEYYGAMDWEGRANLAKLAAILRLADALDRSNSQRIRNIRCTQEDGRLIITVPTADDLSLEQLALRQKAAMFQQIYGMPVLLRNAAEM